MYVTIDDIKEMFSATIVTDEELSADREEFYSEKFDPRWLYEKKYGKKLPKRPQPETVKLSTNQVKFLMELNKVRGIDGENHIRQLRAEAIYALKVGEKISRTSEPTIFSDGTRFGLDGRPECR